MFLSGGQTSDLIGARVLVDRLTKAKTLLADRGYDARAILELIAAHGGRGHIPTQRDRRLQRSVAPAIYRQRNLIERFFNKLKHFRKIATRYEKTARNYLAAVLLASSRIWVRFYESAS